MMHKVFLFLNEATPKPISVFIMFQLDEDLLWLNNFMLSKVNMNLILPIFASKPIILTNLI